MATIFRARRNTNTGSGGKILRDRRISTVTSPYARPISHPLPSSSPPEKPNWLLGLVVPASRMLVNGAEKLVSTVFGSNDDSPSSSETDDSASSFEDDGDEDNDYVSEGSDSLNQNDTNSDGKKFLEKEPQSNIQRSEAKLKIEKLLMQVTFSRDECNRLTKIIQSRVLEGHTAKEGADVGQNELPDRRTASGSIALSGALQSDMATKKSYSCLGNGFDSPSARPLAHHHTAIMEAKKWLENKKSESCSKLEHGQLTFTPSPYKFPNVTKGDMASPLVMAKKYMQSRPPWASPSSNLIGFRTPSPIGMHLVKEETPYTIGAHSLSSSKLITKSSPVDVSRNMAEPLRVRFKSGDDTLQPNSVVHNQSSALDLKYKETHTLSRDETQDVELDVIHDSDSLPATRSLDFSADTPVMITRNCGVTINGGLGNETSSSVPALISNQIQDLEDSRFKEGEGCSKFVTNKLLSPDFVSLEDGAPGPSCEMVKFELNVMPLDDIKLALKSEVGRTEVDSSLEARVQQDLLGETAQVKNSSDLMEMDYADDLRQPGGDHPSLSEANGTRGRGTANGAPSSASSLSVGLNSVTIPVNEGSIEGKLGTSIIPVEEETCELLSEASVEIPNNDSEDTDSVAASVPKTSSSMFLKDLLQIEYQPTSSKSSSIRVEKQLQQGKKIGRYSRRGRGRGK